MPCEYCGCDCNDDEELPRLDSPEIREAAKAIKAVYRYHGGGGHLHSAIDDGNFDSLDGYEDGINENFLDAKPAQIKAERKALKLLESLAIDEREAAVNLAQEQRLAGEDR